MMQRPLQDECAAEEAKQKNRRQHSAQNLGYTTRILRICHAASQPHDRERGEQQKDTACGEAGEERALRPVISQEPEGAKERALPG